MKAPQALPLKLSQLIILHNLNIHHTSADFSMVNIYMHNTHGTQQGESCEKQKRERKKQRSRSGRLALMVNDMLALWLGLAQASELLKYLHGVQNERLIHFKSAGAAREREGAGPLSSIFTALRCSTCSQMDTPT